MDILVFSDTHGNLDRVAEVLCRNDARTVCFLGDGLRDIANTNTAGREIYSVRGNCDWYAGEFVPEERLEVFAGYRVFLTHGHRYSVKSGLGAAVAAAAARGADVLLYGHTHRALEKTYPAGTALLGGRTLEKPLLVVCPGALGDRPATFATLTLRPEGCLAGFGEL